MNNEKLHFCDTEEAAATRLTARVVNSICFER